MLIIEDNIVNDNIEIVFKRVFMFGLFKKEYHVKTFLDKIKPDEKFDYIIFYDYDTDKKIDDLLSSKLTTWLLLNDNYKNFFINIINHFKSNIEEIT